MRAVAELMSTDASRAFINTCANNTQKGETFVSKTSMIRRFTVLFVLIISVVLVGADLIVSAQDTNSSTTQSDEQTRGGMMTSQDDNGPKKKIIRRRGRGRTKRRIIRPDSSGDMSNSNMGGDMSNSNMSTDMSGDAQNTNMGGDRNMNMSGDMGGGGRRGGRRRIKRIMADGTTTETVTTGQLDTERTDGGMQEDLAGQSYTGNASYSEGGVTGTSTLAFESGNQFTLTPEGGTAMSGRYSAVTTRGYTGVTMMFSGATPPQIVSVRLKKMGNGVSIMSVPGESRQFSFTSSGGGSGPMVRKYRRKRSKRRGMTRGGIKPPMATPEQPATP